MVSRCAILGGFAGGEDEAAARNPATNITVLSGDYDALADTIVDTDNDGVPDEFNNFGDNAYHVVTANGVLNSAIDGFTIRLGNAVSGTGLDPYGGGIYITGSLASPLIRGCIIEMNLASTEGGGIFSDFGAHPTVRNCEILNNHAMNGGGGGMLSVTDATILNTVMEQNTAKGGGGFASPKFGRDLTVVSSRISNNVATGTVQDHPFGGGGMYVVADPAFTRAALLIVNTQIDHNTALRGGGIEAQELANFTLVNATIADNTGTSIFGRGAISYSNNLEIPGIVRNSILWANSPDQISQQDPLDVRFSDVEGGWTGTGNIDADPEFLIASDGVYRLDCDLSPCVNAGSDAAVPPDAFDVDEDGVSASPNPSEPTPDLDLMMRIRRGPEGTLTNVDMGAVEGATYHEDCIADTNSDGFVNVTDLLAVIGAWGSCPADEEPCPADVAPGPLGACLDRVVNVTDLLNVIGSWGACAVAPTGQGIGDDELPATYHQMCLILCDGLPNPETCVHQCFQAACETNGVPPEVCDCFEQYFNDEINENGLLRCLGVEVVDPA